MKVGIIGWRGMVGSVLMQRMHEEGDFADIDPVFFSTSQAGEPGPVIGAQSTPLLDAHNIEALQAMDVIVTCQGGGYTEKVHPALRSDGWSGYWIDAASTLRMQPDSTIVLDPVNSEVIADALKSGKFTEKLLTCWLTKTVLLLPLTMVLTQRCGVRNCRPLNVAPRSLAALFPG